MGRTGEEKRATEGGVRNEQQRSKDLRKGEASAARS